MNPQDLLYTNEFVDSNVISSSNLVEHTKHYKQYQRHIHKKRNATEDYITQNKHTNDKINYDKRNANPMPTPSNRNIKPIFSKPFNDIIENKYSKSNKTAISIYSDDRDKAIYMVPNNYIINLGKDFNNIYKIKLIDIDIQGVTPPINKYNNIIKWIYLTEDIMKKCNYKIIPLKDNSEIPSDIYLEDNTTKNSDGSPKEYEVVIPEGYYTTDELVDEMTTRMNIVCRNNTITIAPKFIPNNFYIDIDPHNSITSIVARDTNYYIVGIYSKLNDFYTCNIILNSKISSIDYKNLPYIITGIKNFKGIPSKLINLIELYDLSIENLEEFVSKIDLTIETNIKVGNNTYYIYSINIGSRSFTNIDDTKIIDNIIIGFKDNLRTNQTDFVVYDELFKNDLLSEGSTITDIPTYWRDMTSLPNPIIAQAYPIAFLNTYNTKIKTDLNKQDLTCIDKKNSILSILGWDISVYKDVIIDKTQPFKFVHRNIDTNIANKLNVELLEANKYIFKTIPFVFLKLSFPTLSEDICSGQMIRSTSEISSKLTNEYFYPIRKNISEEDKPCFTRHKLCVTDNFAAPITDKYEVLEKDTKHLFAKIKVNGISGRLMPLPNYQYEHIFYDNPINNIRQIKVEVLSPDGKLMDLTQEHNLTIEIIESIEILKETLLDTKHNNIVTNGAKDFI